MTFVKNVVKRDLFWLTALLCQTIQICSSAVFIQLYSASLRQFW